MAESTADIGMGWVGWTGPGAACFSAGLMSDRVVLVVGGCGYIGSHVVKCLLSRGYRVVVLDDLSAGRAGALLGGELVVGDYGDVGLVRALFEGRRVDGVIHLAGLSTVAESVAAPERYYDVNVASTLRLLSCVRTRPVVFSSSAAVFGAGLGKERIDEQRVLDPASPYGASKAMVERMLLDFDRAHGLRSVSLRCFNAAGADPDGRIGERHEPETHLIPRAFEAALSGEALTICGRDHMTPDGTCVRDYVHVDDLAEGHVLALEALWGGLGTAVFNLGSGVGSSVVEVIDTVAAVLEREVPTVDGPRRAGDPSWLVADPRRSAEVLGWVPRSSGLRNIVEDAWRWHRKRIEANSSDSRTCSFPTQHGA